MVVDKNQEGIYDINRSYAPCVVKESDTSYKMWYGCYDDISYRILYAISTDGINWTNHQLVINIGAEGVYDTIHVNMPCVIKESDTSYKMWYTGHDGINHRILYAISTDGINWTGHQMVVNINNISYDSDGVYGPCVIKESDTSYKMWYGGNSPDNWKIIYAISTDGISWQNPQLVIDKAIIGTYDSSQVREPYIIKESDTSYKMWYSAHDGTRWRILYAESVDGITWTDHKLSIDHYTEESYGTSNSYAPCVIKESDVLYKMWYSGYNSYWSILYTELESSLAAADKSLSFENMTGYRSTVINLPTLIRDRYWKFSWDSDEVSMKVYEARAYKDGNLVDCVMYENVGSGPMTDVATYLQDGDLTSGYFTMDSNNSLGIDLGGPDYIDSLILIHDNKDKEDPYYPIINGSFTANDMYTRLNIRGIDGQIKDYSYYEYDVLTTGNGISLGQGKFDIGTSNNTGVKFSGYNDSYIYIPSEVGTVLRKNRFTIDFFAKFDTLPASGVAVVLAGEWAGAIPERSWDDVPTYDTTKAWLFLVRNTGTSCHFEFWVNHYEYYASGHSRYTAYGIWADDIDIVVDTHYHLGLDRIPGSSQGENYRAYINGNFYGYVNGPSAYWQGGGFSGTRLSIKIGRGFNGVITEFRYALSEYNGYFSSDQAGQKYLSSQYWRQHQRLFKLNIEASADNSFYSEFGSVDTMFDTEYYHYIDGSRYNSLYDTHLLIDLEKRHDLQLLRSYGVSDALSVSLNHFNSSYSPEEISGAGTNSQSKIYIKNNMLYMRNAETTARIMWLESKFIMKGFHNIQLDYILDEYSSTNSWYVYLYIQDVDGTIGWWVRREYSSSGHRYKSDTGSFVTS
jgi:hypothetical protein